jgi:hypothetical protein
MFRLMWLIACLTVLSACATVEPPDSAFDGRYAGVSVRTRGGDTCGPAEYPLSLDVRGGRFEYGVPARRPDVGNALIPVSAGVFASGAVSGQTWYPADNPFWPNEIQPTWATVLGTAGNGRIEAHASSLNCARTLSLTRAEG